MSFVEPKTCFSCPAPATKFMGSPVEGPVFFACDAHAVRGTGYSWSLIEYFKAPDDPVVDFAVDGGEEGDDGEDDDEEEESDEAECDCEARPESSWPPAIVWIVFFVCLASMWHDCFGHH
jgi:hypothetical protein